jgi:hypothetical protein
MKEALTLRELETFSELDFHFRLFFSLHRLTVWPPSANTPLDPSSALELMPLSSSPTTLTKQTSH